ncbi:AcvB/VirJ family lysyl-phosphatidylglycerol hydrolase [Sphingomonas phyllosphaerae]|uniref:AcvB/VirJ family lysyl-phosphatidylglycerol hydrolase n=1 Tax=Sphingomonas phyllosphaerae TaxID=257003 RepID=UPI00040E5FB6|nr:AcvB/VirJ family lysyl-phosphatidylglycerol hydrolase [Sphingomonas phyllosphaerae]
MPTNRRNWLAIVAGAATGAALLVTGFVGYLGYFGGPILRDAPATAPVAMRGTRVLFLSGDMGINAGMGPRLIAALNRDGLPVLAFNSLTAFGTRRPPDEAAAIVAAAVARAERMPGTSRVVLVGQSFGADMLQFAGARLPQNLRPQVRQVILLVPGNTLLFKASPGGVLDGRPDAPAGPSAQRLDWTPVTCIQGAGEAASLCPLLHNPNVRRVALPGGHFLNYDVPLIARTLREAIVNGR